jgi:hypothetical protein
VHNDTDRYLVYINNELVFRSRNKSIRQKEITQNLKTGNNIIAVLYANEFHNKSHPHEGAIVKYSGIMRPFILSGKYKDGTSLDMKLESFYVQQGLRGTIESYADLSYNDSEWSIAPDAGKHVIGRELGHIVWLRRHFTCSVEKDFNTALQYIPIGADERLTAFVNGYPVARYDILGPQEKFYIPQAYLNLNKDNVLAVILECPGFYEEIMSGFRRGFMMSPQLTYSYISREILLTMIN